MYTHGGLSQAEISQSFLSHGVDSVYAGEELSTLQNGGRNFPLQKPI